MILLVWRLEALTEPTEFARWCAHYKVKAVSIKALDGYTPFNTARMSEYVEALKGYSIDVGMWQFCYGVDPRYEGQAVRDIVERYGFVHHLIDAEGGMWNASGSSTKASQYLTALSLPPTCKAYLCTYRFPSNFPLFPFKTFLAHPTVAGRAAPQVYWEFAHNPVPQVQKSYDEYKKLGATEFIPIGPAYFRGVPGAEGSWGPTPNDLYDFAVHCKAAGHEVGLYVADKILKHFNPYGSDWMRAVTGIAPPDVVPPSPPIPPRVLEIVSASLTLRKKPDVLGTSWAAYLKRGMRIEIPGNLVANERDGSIWAPVGDNVFFCVRGKDGTQYAIWR